MRTNSGSSDGKLRCRQFKEMRKILAAANGIDYVEEECTNPEPCAGTCPYCDAKTRELEEKLNRLDRICIPSVEISADQNDYDVDEDRPTMGMMEEDIVSGEISPFDDEDSSLQWNWGEWEGDDHTIEGMLEPAIFAIEDIEDLDLSVRSFNCLKNAGVRTIDQLRSLGLDGLSQMGKLGRKSREEIITRLHEAGIDLE